MAEQSQPGRIVGGRYRLVDRLGAGGMGRVWRAHDQSLGIDVAVKEVSLPFMLSDQQLAERLSRAEREARNTVRLRDQPGIVTVHDVVIDGDAPWIVMQLVAGCSLDEHLRDHGPLSVENTAKVADTMLRALAAAHAAGIVHRDVKPANVLLANDGRVLLTDFGIAHHEGDSSLTMTGAVVGSAEYLAPERARADEAGPPADLFSLGVTLYQAVEGVSPFRRNSPTATMTAVLFEQPPPPKKAGRLTPLLAALLAKEPGQRPTVQAALAMVSASGSGGSGGVGGWASAHGPSAPVVPPRLEFAHQTTTPSPYLAGQTLNAPPPHSGNGSGGGNGAKVGLAVAAVVAVCAVAIFGISHLTSPGKPQAGSSSSSTTNGTPTGSPTSAATTATTTAPGPTDSTRSASQGLTTSETASSDSGGAKPGCDEASRDLNDYNASNPAAHGGKDFQIKADRDLAAKLTADAALATDPAVKDAIQAEADSWTTFADDYAKGDIKGMNSTISQTGKAIGQVQAACSA